MLDAPKEGLATQLRETSRDAADGRIDGRVRQQPLRQPRFSEKARFRWFLAGLLGPAAVIVLVVVAYPFLVQRGDLVLEHERVHAARLGARRLPAVRVGAARARVLGDPRQDAHLDHQRRRLPRDRGRLSGRDAAPAVRARQERVADAAHPAVGRAAVHHRAHVARHVQLRVRRGQPLHPEVPRRAARGVADQPDGGVSRGDPDQRLARLSVYDGDRARRAAVDPGRALRGGGGGRRERVAPVQGHHAAAA